MTFAEFLVNKWRSRPAEYDGSHGLPIHAEAGQFYSTLTGSDPPTIDIDWDKLQEEIAMLEQEFAGLQKDANQ